MGLYVLLMRDHSEGLKAMKSTGPAAVKAVSEALERWEAKVIMGYRLLGEWDQCYIIEAPDNFKAYRATLAQEMSTTMDTEILPAVDLPLFQRLMSQSATTAGPHAWQISWCARALSLDSGNLPRVVAIQGSRCTQRIREELQAEFCEQVNILDSIGPTGKIILAITARDATKGAALNAACAHMGFTPAQVVAFGDAENDVDMFRLAGASVAMDQADAATREAASFVSKANTDGGVAHAIWRLLEREEL